MQARNERLHGVFEEERVHVEHLWIPLERLLQMPNGQVRTEKQYAGKRALKVRQIAPT